MFLPPLLLQEMPHDVTGRMAYACLLTISAQQIVPTARHRITAHLVQTNVAAGKNLDKD